MKMSRNLVWLAVSMATLLMTAPRVPAYVLYGDKWPFGSRVIMQLELENFSGQLIDGTVGSWNVVAQGALAEWNTKIQQVQFEAVMYSNAPIAADNGSNNVFWSDNIYGQAFGPRTLAYTTFWWVGASTRTEADVVFNNGKLWNSYRGPLKDASGGGYLYDFRRVALHEFGHVLGLRHPDDFGQHVVAQMNSITSDLDDLAADDIEGAQSLYGAPVVVVPTATLAHPTPGSTLSAADIVFTWNRVSGSVGYRLRIGNAPGKSDCFDSHNLSSALSSLKVPAIPSDGRLLYIRLSTDHQGTWYNRDYTYTALKSYSGLMIHPFPGDTVASPVTFQWRAGIGASAYRLWVGTAPGKSNLYHSKTLGHTAHSLTVRPRHVPKLYVRLSTLVGGIWYNRDYVYKE